VIKAPSGVAGLHVLEVLNRLNTDSGKHLGGDEIAWKDVVDVHAGLYWALRALLSLSDKLGFRSA
jgi:hypothetical protein